jgi:two-component system NtrC family sensor kinase
MTLEIDIDALEREVGALAHDSPNALVPPTMRHALERMGIQVPAFHRVLVVDDDPGNLAVLEALLETEFDVHVAESGAEALAVLARVGPVDLVLSDQRMPGMTGVELLGRLAVSAPETIRVILTAYTDAEPIVDAVNRGAVYRFLLKPWHPDALRSTVRDGLELKTRRWLLAELLRRLDATRDEQAATFRNLERARGQLFAAERFAQLGRITSGVTHDINNHLSAMVYLVEALRAPERSAALRCAAESAVEALESLLTLVQDVNAFARQREIRLRTVQVELGPFMAETFGLVRLEPGFATRELQGRTATPDASARFDPSRVRQALMALVRNAHQWSPASALIEVSASIDPDGVCFEVRDSGVGMDETCLRQALEPFFSGMEPPGLGLGLSIVDLVARAHGGDIQLRSTQGVGTIARLRLRQPTDHSVGDFDE